MKKLIVKKQEEKPTKVTIAIILRNYPRTKINPFNKSKNRNLEPTSPDRQLLLSKTFRVNSKRLLSRMIIASAAQY